MAVISESLTGTGATSELPVGDDGAGFLQISGTFVATLDLQARATGSSSWQNVDVDTGTATWTAPDFKRFELGASGLVRINCSAYTSGTINVSLKS